MISTIFEMSNLSDAEKYILQNLTLVPIFGISTEDFYAYCKLDTYEHIDELIAKNLILHDSAKDFIALHPVIHRTILKQLPYDDSVCGNYMQSVIDLLNRAKYIEYIQRETVMEMMEQIMRILPATSVYYIPFYLACGKAYHAFAKHRFTIERTAVLNNNNIPLAVRVEALTEIADAYRCMEVSDKLYEYAAFALELCNKLDQSEIATKRLLADINGRFGWYYHLNGNYPQSFEYFYQQMILMFETEPEVSEKLGWAYYNVALAKLHCGDAPAAIDFFGESLKQFAALNMDFGIANAYASLGVCNNALNMPRKALECQLMALDLFQCLLGENHNDTAHTKHLISITYLKLGDKDTALQYHNEAIACIESLGCLEIAEHWTIQFMQECP